MKKYLFCLSLMLSGVACADEISNANKLLAAKSYPQALQSYTKLANAGNAEAQFHLGEMHWRGDGVPADPGKAEAWLQKAAAKGYPAAVALLEVMRQRQLHRDDIDFWLTRYDGADLKTGKFACKIPTVPAISKNNDDIHAITTKFSNWQNCYNDFAANLNASMPAEKHLPSDIAKLMSQAEIDQSLARLDEVFARVATDAKMAADIALADYHAWRSATDAFVAEQNADALKRSATPTSNELRPIEIQRLQNVAPKPR